MERFPKKEVLTQTLESIRKIDDEVDSTLNFLEEQLGKDYGLSTLQIAISITLSELMEDLEAMGGS